MRLLLFVFAVRFHAFLAVEPEKYPTTWETPTRGLAWQAETGIEVGARLNVANLIPGSRFADPPPPPP